MKENETSSVEYTKVTHVELSDGGTNIVSNKECPLSVEEIEHQDNAVNVKDGIIVPCCNCRAYLDIQINKGCSHYFGCTYSDEKGIQIDCRHIDYEERTTMEQ